MPHPSRNTPRPGRPRRRGGFTVLELLVAITIIAILASLLLVAVRSVTGSADEARIAADLNSADTGIVNFKKKYGVEPPSSITLYEEGGVWDNNARLKISSIWPQFDFSIDRDIDGDGTPDEVLQLNGAECLVFFLGGVTMDGVPNGFSNNPTNPFSRQGTSRVQPMTFDNRFVDRAPADGMLEWLDSASGQANPVYYVHRKDYSSPAAALDGAVSGLPAPNDTMAAVYSQGSSSFWNPQGYQLISPGRDTAYGLGGVYNADSADTALAGDREAERDNITNFSSGALAN